MASCGLGIPGLKFGKLDLVCVRPKLSTLHSFQGLVRSQGISFPFDGLAVSHRSSSRAKTACQSSNVRADSAAAASANLEDNDSDEIETVLSDQPSTLIPNSFEVESLLTELCSTTSIAKFELKLGGFHLHVTRNLADQTAPPQPSLPAPSTKNSVVETPEFNGSALSPSLALTKPEPSSGSVRTLLDTAADEGLKILQSPRVGYFRRSRTIKGKRAPPSCKEKDVVKEGQVLCYIEQLGGEIPVESDASGEVVKILREDGEPVGYGDALIAILPSFPGIMKLQ
ncbi:uncharacterized protein LOC127243140 [Andrographis paniculata]|uniref:uncharacterized protein LOC127243140 n=1 Tax=Andrographis paniculata TaxID=175694 RepID=UPI0021E8EB6A|nr:uncharacterized protein LOC127243140 [Andrographis paniculata]